MTIPPILELLRKFTRFGSAILPNWGNHGIKFDDDDETWLMIKMMLKMRLWRKKMQSFANWNIFNFAKKN